MPSQLDQSYTGDFGGSDSLNRQKTVNNQIPSNFPAPPNLGGEVGQLEMGWPHTLDQSTQFDCQFEPSLGSTTSTGMGAVEKSDSFESYMDNSLGAKIL